MVENDGHKHCNAALQFSELRALDASTKITPSTSGDEKSFLIDPHIQKTATIGVQQQLVYHHK